MSNIKSLRLKDDLLKQVENLAKTNGIAFNNQVIKILVDFLESAREVPVNINEEIYYPTHLSNEELLLIMEEFLANFEGGNNCIVKVRKDGGGKGIEFQINIFTEYKAQNIKKKRYNFSINANWKLENAFEHWLEKSQINTSASFLSFKKIINFKILTINNILIENSNHKITPELNPIFKDDKWKIIYERKYPILNFT
jgi:hypothetical protein